MLDERPPKNMETIKSMVTVPEVAELLGLDPNHGSKIRSPFNEADRTPSCHLYEDHWWDFSTGRGGDVVDLVVAVEHCTPAQALDLLYRGALRAGYEPGDVERQPVRALVDFTAQLATVSVDPDPVEFWDSKITGVDMGLLFRLGDAVPALEAGRRSLLIPHRHGWVTYGVKVRGEDGSKSAWAGSQFTHRLYKPYPDVRRDQARAIMCEGESDAWALGLVRPEIDVYALPSGAGSWKDQWLKQLKQYKTVFLCFDNDQAGKQALDKVTRKIGWDRAEQLPIPKLYKDAREAVAAGWRPNP